MFANKELKLGFASYTKKFSAIPYIKLSIVKLNI